MSLHFPPGSAVADIDPAHGLVGPNDAEIRNAWALLDRRILSSLTPEWVATRSGTHHGYDVLARSRLHVICVGVQESGYARIVVDFRPDLEGRLKERIPWSAQSTGALLFERLARFTPVCVVQATQPMANAVEVA